MERFKVGILAKLLSGLLIFAFAYAWIGIIAKGIYAEYEREIRLYQQSIKDTIDQQKRDSLNTYKRYSK